MQPPFDLTVIVAEARDNPDLEPVLAAIERTCAGLAAEVLVVRPPGRLPLRSSSSVALRELPASESTLVPDRWGIGVRAGSAPVFGCLTTELSVHPAWAHTLLEALNSGAVGAASAIGLTRPAGMVATAVYLVRFNAFLPDRTTGSHIADSIPGDAAVYRRNAVTEFADLLAEGFWEAEFHRRFKAQGSQLSITNEALSNFHSSLTLRSAVTVRARHGRGYGITRVRDHGENRARLLLSAPLVPAILLARILRRAARSPGALRLAIRAFPALVMICAAWAWGEASGAWSTRSNQ